MYGEFTKYPNEFWKDVQINAGIVVTGFTVTNGKATYTGIKGATGDGLTFNPNPTFEDFGSDIDNVPANSFQLKRLTGYDPSLSGTFKTITEELAQELCPGTVSSGVIKPADKLTDDMFQDIAVIGDYSDNNKNSTGSGSGKAGFVAVVIKKALNTTGFQWKTNKDGKGEFAFDFHGHYDLANPDDPPFELYVTKGVAEA